jgi:hypothetical protein
MHYALMGNMRLPFIDSSLFILYYHKNDGSASIFGMMSEEEFEI